MTKRIRNHIRSNVIGYVALFFALSTGSAVALSGSNTVQSDDLGPGSQVKAADVADNAINSADLVNNSLTGTDINESTLQGVNAATVGGGTVCDGVVELSTTPSNNPVNQVVCTAGPLSIRATCTSAGQTNAALAIENSADNSFYTISGGAEDADWDNAEADPTLVTLTAFSGTPDMARAAFSAGADNGGQLAGEVAVRSEHIATATGTCQFMLGVIG
jgi:hypothetical protein